MEDLRGYIVQGYFIVGSLDPDQNEAKQFIELVNAKVFRGKELIASVGRAVLPVQQIGASFPDGVSFNELEKPTEG